MPTYRFDVTDHKQRTYFVEAKSEELGRRRIFGGDKLAGTLLRSDPAPMKREIVNVTEVNSIEPTSGIHRVRRQIRRLQRKALRQVGQQTSFQSVIFE